MIMYKTIFLPWPVMVSKMKFHVKGMVQFNTISFWDSTYCIILLSSPIVSQLYAWYGSVSSSKFTKFELWRFFPHAPSINGIQMLECKKGFLWCHHFGVPCNFFLVPGWAWYPKTLQRHPLVLSSKAPPVSIISSIWTKS